ncbi:MAG TPA: DUF6328 family protein, partial [Acidimicrobiales bacterium]|nr:DUF6328 family protein [Acidimicrobiales bacterium]
MSTVTAGTQRYARDDDGRPESPAQRSDRNVAELLQELRIAGLGVQVLFGFLLSIPFSQRFRLLVPFERGLYVASLIFAILAIALLAMPVAFHRLVFHRHKKEALLQVGNAVALLWLGSVALSVACAATFVLGFVLGAAVAVATGA